MSLENIQAFLEKVRSDPEFRNKIRPLADEDTDRYLETLAAIASEAGYPFTREELLQAAKAASSRIAGHPDELDDTRLESVAGGVSKDVFWYSVETFFVGCLNSLVTGCDLEEKAKIARQQSGPIDPSFPSF